MKDETIGNICITICILAVLLLLGLWLYWAMVVQRRLDMDMARTLGAEAYLKLRQCAAFRGALCGR